MSFCDEKLLKLNERMERPLPFYRKNQIMRTRLIATELADGQTGQQKKENEEQFSGKANSTLKSADLRFYCPPATSDSPLFSGVVSELIEAGKLKDFKLSRDFNNAKVINSMRATLNEENQETGLENNRNQEDVLGRRDSLQERLFLESAKRIKESHNFDSSSNFLLINQGMEQKNKITDYFKGPAQPEGMEKKSFENLTTFSQANLLIKNEQMKIVESPMSGKWEMILMEKEKEIGIYKRQLKTKEDQEREFKEKSKELFSQMIVEMEEMKRAEKKKFIVEEKLRLGEFMTYRDGAHLKEVWINGMEIRMLKEELQKTVEQKEQIENLKKKMKRKTGRTLATEEKGSLFPINHSNSNIEKIAILTANGIAANYNSYATIANAPYLGSFTKGPSNISRDAKIGNSIYKNGNLNPDMSDSSNTFSLMQEKNIEENRERLYSRLLILSKEENYLKERIDTVERQKDNYMRLAKQLFEEENCRFGRLSSDPESRWPMLKNRYQIFGLMGKGGFSEVYKAFDCEELRIVACKIHQLSPSWSENFKSNYIKHALRENQVHKNLIHPNIVSHFDSVEIDSNSFCAVLEYCNGPDLASYLRKYKTIPEKDAKSITKQILSGLKFLNETSKKIIHYDLKPQNILFHDGLVKISDFGLCKVMNEGETRLELTSQGVGTYWYLPPECFYNNYPKISTKVDVWSIGVIMYELLYGIKPFGNDMCQERILKEGIMLRAYTLDFPAKPSISSELKELVRKCLEYNQEERPDVIEIWNWINKM